MVDSRVDNRVTVRVAAQALGISEGAVRKRIDRGTLKYEKGENGKVYVYLPAVDDTSTPHESYSLISEMRERISFLEEEMRRKDAILLNMTETMKALTSSSELRESPEKPSDGADRGTGPAEASGRSWWRRFFGW